MNSRYNLHQARKWREQMRRQGRRVCFTNGCFDLLHAGHVHLLVQARLAADELIVGLNSDESVRRLKGEPRPFVPELERAELLAALVPVDRVVIYNEQTPLETIVALEPDVLVKGADWEEDKIIGAEQVRGWGGDIVRVKLREGLSTSSLVDRIRERCGGR